MRTTQDISWTQKTSCRDAKVNIRRLSLVLTLCLAGAFVASYACFRFGYFGQERTYKTVSAADAKGIMEANPSLLILDVRTAQEYSQGHLRGAVNIPASELSRRTGELGKNRAILVYCQSGSRSAQASSILVEAGFTHIYNMEGGITTWINSGYPTATE